MFKYGRVNLYEPVAVHKITGSLPELATTHQAFADFRVDIHINITTTVALLFICEPIVAGKWTEGFGE